MSYVAIRRKDVDLFKNQHSEEKRNRIMAVPRGFYIPIRHSIRHMLVDMKSIFTLNMITEF